MVATGRRMEIAGISIDRFDESGRLVEEWPAYDMLGAMKQLWGLSLGPLSKPGAKPT